MALASLLFMAIAPAAGGATAPQPTVTVKDLGLATGFQDTQFGHLQRGRALVAADFNLDGRQDFYVGNPGDQSYVLVNVDDGGGRFHFEVSQLLLTGTLSWGATTFDYDNDGDPDLFVTDGGNEGIGFNHLFKNNWVESGGTNLSFTEVTDQAGVAGPVPAGQTDPIPVSNAGAVAADYNLDGWTDVFVSVNITPDSLPELKGRNELWRNNGDGTFTDVTDKTGLGVTREQTRHSTWIDYNNDGRPDLYENNMDGFNHMWENTKKGDDTKFVDVTAALSPPGENLACPFQSFDSVATDLNNDGWEDLIVFMRWDRGEPPPCPYGPGHALFINQGGTGFVNIGPQSHVDQPFVFDKGVMGCQVGDVNGDGAPDIYIGNGAPMDSNSPLGGQFDELLISSQAHGRLPVFTSGNALINVKAPENPSIRYPPFPYRTHGTVITDVDGDGTQEIAVAEGGPAKSPDYVQEPDRLFKFTWDQPANWLIVHPVGDAGAHVSSDAIGTRFALTVKNEAGDVWTIHQTLFGGSCFSASNGFDVYFGLSDATQILSLQIGWADGTVQTLTTDLTINTRRTVAYGGPEAGSIMGGKLAAVDTTAQVRALLSSHPRPSLSSYRIPDPSTLMLSCDLLE